MQLAGTQKVSALERVRRDWSGWRKEGTWRGGGSGLVRTKKKKRGHSLAHVELPRTQGKKEGQSATGQYMEKASEYRHSPMECLRQCCTGNGGGDGSEGET